MLLKKRIFLFIGAQTFPNFFKKSIRFKSSTSSVDHIIKKFYLSNIWFEQRWKEGTEYQQGIMAGHYKGIFFENVFSL